MSERDAPFLLVTKSLIAAFGVLFFLFPLATPAGMLAGVAGTIGAYLLAHYAAGRGLRLPVGLLIAALVIASGQLAAQLILNHSVSAAPSTTIWVSDLVFFGAACLGLFFGLRLLSQRARVFSVLELAVVVGAVAHTFADHRHQHIHQPRFFSDWAWARGLDPSMILEAAGVAAMVLAVVLLLRTRDKGKLFFTLLALIAGGVIAFFLLKDVRVGTSTETDEGLAGQQNDGDSKSDKNNDKNNSSSSGGKPPDPVAVAILHDDLPDDTDILYFRQAVLSRFATDRLVEDTSGNFDKDVIKQFPSAGPIDVDSPQDPGFHREIHSSMYLLVDHAQPFGLGHPIEMSPLPNPDTRRFVAAYDVTSRFLHQDLTRLVGRTAMPASWTAEQKAHYLEMPNDPRYKELSDRLVRDMDPRFVGDDLMKALAIKRYLETHGFYSLKEKVLSGTDPTAKFLFGTMRGYCVHFAHSAVLLFRSQGIPARVALGYGVETRRRGAGSSLVIFGNEAHAWPEIYVDGVGWVTFDIYPEHSDSPPPTFADQDMESVLGELARKDKTGGRGEDPNAGLHIPWAAIGLSLLGAIVALLLAAYSVKGWRRVVASSPRLVYRGALDRLSDIGAQRRIGETRERHAARVARLSPSFAALTTAHLRDALGTRDPAALSQVSNLSRAARDELRRNTPFFTRLAGLMNPLGWWVTR